MTYNETSATVTATVRATKICSSKLPENQLLEFALLIGNLKKTRRAGWVRKNIPNCESIADHMYRMSILAWIFGEQFAHYSQTNDNCHKNIDNNKLIKMALVHDMIESIVGDIIPIESISGVSAKEKRRRELNAMIEIRDKYLSNSAVGQEMYQLWIEFENAETIEARIVKDLDKLDMIIQAEEYECNNDSKVEFDEFFDSTRGVFRTGIGQAIDKHLRSKRRKRKQSIVNIEAKEKEDVNRSLFADGSKNGSEEKCESNPISIIDHLLNIL